MTIKELQDIIIHFQDSEYDDFEVVLFDYNNQRELSWGPSYAFSKPQKQLTFPITCPPVDGIQIEERLRKVIQDFEQQGLLSKDQTS